MNLFCGGKFSDRVSSEKLLAVSAAGPPAAFFPEIDISGFFGHDHFGKKCISLYLMTFSKMGMSKKSRHINPGKNARGPAAETARSFSEDTLFENLPPQNKCSFAEI